MKRIAFVGLGHMGLPMAMNLVKHGYEVKGFDLQKEAMQALVEAGGTAIKLREPTSRGLSAGSSDVERFMDPADKPRDVGEENGLNLMAVEAGGQHSESLEDIAADADIIITMLQTPDQVKAVCLGDKGVFAHARPGILFIDCSSIDVNSSREIHTAARQKGINSLDAPVSGGVAGAAAATLTFMVGGESDVFALARPVFEAMGQTIIHAGKAGSGEAAKICNNMILGISMIAVSEAFVLAEQLGLTADKLFEVVNHASGQCWVMSKYPPLPGLVEQAPANNDYRPGFTANMMLKDLNLSQAAAASVSVKTTVAAKARDIYQQFIDDGLGELDFSAIIQSISTLRTTDL